MLIFIDHQDSFSWNLIAQLRRTGREVRVLQSASLDTAAVASLLPRAEAVVFSPGPGHPRDYPNSVALYRAARGHCPILGICLGFQLMLHAEGREVGRLPQILHGVQSLIHFDPSAVAFAGLKEPLLVGRYHSLGLTDHPLPSGWHPTSRDISSGRILSFECPHLCLFGCQFHPDSFLTPGGDQIIANMLRACTSWISKPAPGRLIMVDRPDLWGEPGAFTTLRLRRGESAATLHFPATHAARLARDLAALSLPCPPPGQLQSDFLQATLRAIRDLPNGDYLVRWSCSPPAMAVAVRPAGPGGGLLRAELHPYRRSHPLQKSLDYQELLRMMARVDRATTEIILCHPDGRLLEGITCNLLCFDGGAFHTPGRDCLPGLTLGLLEPWITAKFPIERRDIPVEELPHFAAIFLCGSGRGVASIGSIAGHSWQPSHSGPIDFLRECHHRLSASSSDVHTF